MLVMFCVLSSAGVRLIFPNALGTRSVIIDDTHQGYLYNPVDDATLVLPVTRSRMFLGNLSYILARVPARIARLLLGV